MNNLTISSDLDNKDVCYGKLSITLRDKNGNILKRSEQNIESFIRQYWAIHRALQGGFNNTFLLPLSGSGRTFDQPIGYDAGGGANSYNSIVVGSGTNQVQYTNTTLQTLILHGNTTGRLAASIPIMGHDPSTGQVTITRTFTNNFNGFDPTVNEVGVAVGLGNETSTGGEVFLAIRDTTDSSFVVLYQAVLTVTYTLYPPFGTNNYSMLFLRHTMARNNNEMVMYNTDGSTVNSTTWSDLPASLSFVSTVGSSNRGIVLGDSSNSYSFNTFAMSNQIGHGSNVGQLFYYDSAISSLEEFTSTSNSSTWYLTRTFVNKSNSSITVREVGLVSNVAIGTTNNTYLYDRRVIPDTTIAAGDLLTVNWKFKYDF